MERRHRIEKFEDVASFKERVKYYNETDIECTSHTFFRLSEKQRKIFTCYKIAEFLLYKTPAKVGVQYNQNYAVFYDYKERRILKVVIRLMPNKINIVTFYILDSRQLPR
ncbi:MAG: hypothetical protein HY051_00460 [Candidatus Aenigmarchaeota archaeon]|nr:hypothetical protein [Candidatus Aenigmarchaeota archaeon]